MLANYILHYQHRPTDGAVFTQLNTVTHRRVKIHTITRHECPQGEHRYKASTFLTSVLDGGRVVNATHRPLCPRKRASVFIVEEAGWAPKPVWTVTVAPTGLQTPGPSSPYRLRYLCTHPKARSKGKRSYNCSRLSNVLTGQDCHVVIRLLP